LNVDQTALNRDLRPEPVEHPEQMGIPVHRGASRDQTPFFQVGTESQEVVGALGDIVGSHEELMALGIHHGKDSSASFQVSPIENNMAIRCKVSFPLRRMTQPVFQNATDRRDTTTALTGQLLDRIAFLNPSPEPNALPDMPVRRDPPPVSVATTATEPALLFTPIFPIALYVL
jgi:hypothetical protein